MKNLKSASLGAAAAAFLSVACIAPSASATTPMSAHQEMVVKSCMAMPGEQMLRNSGCKAVMAKMNVRRSDMQTMISCRELSHEGMMDNPDCSSMMRLHPDMMKMPTGG